MTDCLRPDITEYLRWRLQLELGISRGKRVATVHALSLHTRQDGGIVLSYTLRGQVRHNVIPESVYEHPRYALASEAPQHFRDAPLEALVAQSLGLQVGCIVAGWGRKTSSVGWSSRQTGHLKVCGTSSWPFPERAAADSPTSHSAWSRSHQ